MNEWLFVKELESKGESLTDKAISLRVSRARRAERILQEDLDHIVSNDDRMYSVLIALKSSPEERNGNMQNALRWYYRAIRGTEFPKLNEYHSKKPDIQNADTPEQAATGHQPHASRTLEARKHESTKC